MKIKIKKCSAVGTGFGDADGGAAPSRWIAPEFDISGKLIVDGNGAVILWYWTKDDAPDAPFSDPPDPSDMTDAQIAADPSFQLVQRIIKAARTSGPTNKRPASLDSTDKGFEYFDTTIDRPIWWSGTKWKFADGANA